MAQLGDAEQREMDVERLTGAADGEQDPQEEGEGEGEGNDASVNPGAAINHAGEQDVSFDSLLIPGKDRIANQDVYFPNDDEQIKLFWIKSLLSASKTLSACELFRAFHENDKENGDLIHITPNVKSIEAALTMHNLQDLLHFYENKILISDSKTDGTVSALIEVNPTQPASKAWLLRMLRAFNLRMTGILENAYKGVEQNYKLLASVEEDFTELGLDDPVKVFCKKLLKLHNETMDTENKENKENKDESYNDRNIAQIAQKQKRKWGKHSHKKNKNKNKPQKKGNGKAKGNGKGKGNGAMEKNSKNKP